MKLTRRGPFKAGVYDGLHAPEAMSDVVKRLERAPLPPATRNLVIPEGLWLSEIRAKILQTFPEMKPADLDHALATVHSKYQPAGSTNLEGFLFPATYQVLLTDVGNPQKLVAQMVDQVRPGGRQPRPGAPRRKAWASRRTRCSPWPRWSRRRPRCRATVPRSPGSSTTGWQAA